MVVDKRINKEALDELIISAQRGKKVFDYYKTMGRIDLSGIGHRTLSDLIVDVVNFKRMAEVQMDLFVNNGETLSNGLYLKAAGCSKESFEDIKSSEYTELLYQLCDTKLAGDWSRAKRMIEVCNNLVSVKWRQAFCVT